MLGCDTNNRIFRVKNQVFCNDRVSKNYILFHSLRSFIEIVKLSFYSIISVNVFQRLLIEYFLQRLYSQLVPFLLHKIPDLLLISSNISAITFLTNHNKTFFALYFYFFYFFYKVSVSRFDNKLKNLINTR